MKKEWLVKPFALGIVVLFIGAGVVSALNINLIDEFKPLSRGNILYVGGSGTGNYTHIQDAIDNASDGDTVFVYDDSSPYFEKYIHVNKQIYLIGENKYTTIIEKTSHGEIIDIWVNQVVISGFTIQGNGHGLGIYLRTDYNTIEGNIIKNNYDGLIITGNNNVVKNNIIQGNKRVFIETANLNQIISNNFIDNEIGLEFFYHSFFNIVKKNNFIRNNCSAYFYNSFVTIWKENYWDEWDGIGKYFINGCFEYIIGRYPGHTIFKIPLNNFDWHPAKEPYVI